jgi:hypothetical protein
MHALGGEGRGMALGKAMDLVSFRHRVWLSF